MPPLSCSPHLRISLSGRRWVVLLGGVGLALVVGLAVLLWPRADEDRVWQHVTESGVLRVGLDASYPPFEFIDQGGDLAGFDVDLAEELGHRLGLTVTYINLGYDGLLDALLVDQVDVLVSALVITPELQGRVAFTAPYFNAGQYLVVPEGAAIAEMDDLDEYGSSGDVEARAWQRRLADLTIARYDTPNAALRAVIEGEANAALTDGISARLFVGEQPSLKLADNVTDELFGIAVDLKSYELRQRINDALREMLRDGTIERLIEKWFGVA